MDKKLKLLKKRNEHVATVCEATGWNKKRALAEMKAAKAMGMPYFRYVKNECWALEPAEIKALNEKIERRLALKNKKKEHLETVMQATGWDEEKALAEMEKAKKAGMPYFRYANNACWTMDIEQIKKLNKEIEEYKKNNEKALLENSNGYEVYEYKNPSYVLVDRKGRYTIDEDANRADSRFFCEDGKWVSAAGRKEEITLMFAGDLLCQENIINSFKVADDKYDFSTCFDHLRPVFKSADFVAGNLETPVSEQAPYRGEILTHEGPFFCNAPVEYLEALKYAGFDMLTTANNHTIDAGVSGLMDTIENTEKFGFIQTGTFKTKEEKFKIVDICGFKVGFTAFSTTYNKMQENLTQKGRIHLLNTYTKNRAQTLYDEMKAQGAEYIVCFPHWGKEFEEAISEKQAKAADELTKIGYDFVVGSHSHVVQKMTDVNGKPVLYSLGNLLTHLNLGGQRMDSQYPVICKLVLKREGGKIKADIDYIPCRIVRGVENVPFQILPCVEELSYTEEEKEKLERVPDIIKALLKGSDDMLDLNYKLKETAKSEYRKVLETRAERTAMLQELHEVEKARHHTREKEVYNKVLDRAELIEENSDVTVVRLKKLYEGLPVTHVKTKSEGNDIMRVLYIGAYVEYISEDAFSNYTALESVRFYNELKYIGKRAFKNCSSLIGIILPNSLLELGDEAFAGCVNLRSIKIPYSVKKIGENAFAGCDDLIIYCEEGSYAEEFALEHGIDVKYMPIPRKLKPDIAFKDDYNKSDNDEVKFGPMNGPHDPHPKSIIATCIMLGVPLPENAVCGYQPSYYIEDDLLTASLADIKEFFGDKMPDIDEEELITRFRMFERKFKSQKNLTFTKTDFVIYFCDWLFFARDRGFTHNCYFDYELYRKEPDVRDTFLNEGQRIRVHEACRTKGFGKLFLDKAEFNRHFAKFVQRDWVDASMCSFEEFREFAEKHDKFFGKPVRGTGGAGARVIHRDKFQLEELFEICKAEDLICEELIQQHESIASINASTLNTVRVTTLLDTDNVAHIVLTVARFGREGKAVDNFHGGGVGAIVNIDTGLIETEAINMSHLRSAYHPDSKTRILGFQYPEWEKVKAAVCEAATMVPEMRNIGWDVSVTKDGNVEFVEGNGRPNYDVLQSPDQVGRRFRYEPWLTEIEKMKGIETVVLPPLEIEFEDAEANIRKREAFIEKNKGN